MAIVQHKLDGNSGKEGYPNPARLNKKTPIVVQKVYDKKSILILFICL